MKRRLSKLLLLAVIVIILSSCETIGYYGQGMAGHARLMWSRQPVIEVVTTAQPDLQQRLQTAIAIRQFAITDLGLPDNKSYSTYVELDRDAVVWNVVATAPFSLQAKQWCYPVIGCASYRGYFKQVNAQGYAEKLQAQGLDVAVVGATAYSTLGWFSDPLTSLMLRSDDAGIAELLFHELAHQQLYIKGNSRFNEAFATTVGEQGTVHWLQVTAQGELLQRYQRRLVVRAQFLRLLNQTREQLQTLYQNAEADEYKAEQKQQLFLELRQSYEELKQQQWQGIGWYDGWFKQPVNNARLVAIGTYRDLVPAFTKLLAACGQDFERFYQAAPRLIETATLHKCSDQLP